MSGVSTLPGAVAEELAQLAREAKRVARRYYQLTGKPLGVTGEIAELEAARLLNLRLANARQSGWDAIGTRPDGTEERLQIKGRWLVNGYKPAARIGAIDAHDDFDAVLLVLLDEALEVRSIHRLGRDEVRQLLNEPGSKARNERGMMSVGAFVNKATTVWVSSQYRLPDIEHVGSEVPLEEKVASYLAQSNVLAQLCGPKLKDQRNLREGMLEAAVAELLRRAPGVTQVTCTARIATTLGIPVGAFPSQTIPDVVAHRGDGVEIFEVKSGRVDYGRFDKVVGKEMRAYLDSHGMAGLSPWEVEQDLIRLQAYYTLSPKVQRATLILVDAYAGKGRSWSKAFNNADVLRELLVTPMTKQCAEALVAATHISTVTVDGLSVRVIRVSLPAPT